MRQLKIRLQSIMVVCFLFFSCVSQATEIEPLELDIIAYDAFMEEDGEAMQTLKNALFEKGIVGIRGIPGYQDKVKKFIEAARVFSLFPEEIRDAYAPKPNEMFTGYEKGKEKFQLPDGRWVVDDLKNSYYAFVPDTIENKWPSEIDLRTPFQEMGLLMSKMGTTILEKIGLVGAKTGIYLESTPQFGRMLHYALNKEASSENPYWCGAHYDHGMFTALIPAFYFVDGIQISEPVEAGLFIKDPSNDIFRKVFANDPDVMLFQVGEFSQLATNDEIRATMHRVHKSMGPVQRFTMALFINPPMDTEIKSYSVLTHDNRYGGEMGDACTYKQWHEASFARYIAREREEK